MNRMNEIKWNRTDLIDEAEEVVVHRTKEQKDTLKRTSGIYLEESEQGRVRITKVDVDEEGEQRIGKKKGQYVTLTLPTLYVDDVQGLQQLEEVLLQHLDDMHKHIEWQQGDKVLVIGLGNRTITPDAIGPDAIDLLHGGELGESSEALVMYAPGVTGQTGYETSEFVAAIADRVKPNCIFVIDALASRATERLCKTIQLTNTGIHPGSGVGNARKEISYEQLNIPVTAIGVPTVVDAPVMIADAVEMMMHHIASRIEEKGKPSSRLSVGAIPTNSSKQVDFAPLRSIFGEWSTWDAEDRRTLFQEVFHNHPERLIVTPKEIDLWVKAYSKLISHALLKWVAQKTTNKRI